MSNGKVSDEKTNVTFKQTVEPIQLLGEMPNKELEKSIKELLACSGALTQSVSMLVPASTALEAHNQDKDGKPLVLVLKKIRELTNDPTVHFRYGTFTPDYGYLAIVFNQEPADWNIFRSALKTISEDSSDGVKLEKLQIILVK